VRTGDLKPGTPVLVYLHSPREKVFGVLLSLEPAGVVVRGLDIVSFEDWMRQEARGDGGGLALVSVFYPMGRVERVERDETLGEIEGFADRYERLTGRSFTRAAGLSSRRKPR
jgi:hypothetical protein